VGLRGTMELFARRSVPRCCSSLARAIGGMRPAILLCAAIVTTAAAPAAAETQCRLIDKVNGASFKVFDALLYQGKPGLESHCMERLNIIYGGVYWPQGAKRGDFTLPPIAKVIESAAKAGLQEGPSALDIEHWPVGGESSLVDASLDNYLTVLRWFKATQPAEIVGYYGVVPTRDYWRAVKEPSTHGGQAGYEAWQAENDRLRPLADAVDVLFPSIYTFYPDREGWKLYAAAQIAESRRLASGKPVYAFLWPQYHDSNRILGEQYLPPDYWRMELEFLREHADGVVIWGGWQQQWDEDAPWWVETKAFLSGGFERITVPGSD